MSVATTCCLLAECPGWDAAPRGGEMRHGDIGSLDWPDNSFDATVDSQAVYCSGFEDSQRIYREMYRVTKPGGRLFVRTFAAGSWGDGIGQQVGPRSYIAPDGPLAGKGLSRFTDFKDIPDLLGPWTVVEVEMITRTLRERTQEIREWIIHGVKPE